MSSPPTYPPNRLTATTLKLVRYAMFAFLLLFGGIAYWQSTHRGEPADPQAPLDTFRYVGYALCVAAIVAMGVIRGIRARAEPAGRITWSLVGSAVAEGAALFGAVYVLMGGEPWIYLLALLVFLATWAVLPADPEVA